MSRKNELILIFLDDCHEGRFEKGNVGRPCKQSLNCTRGMKIIMLCNSCIQWWKMRKEEVKQPIN